MSSIATVLRKELRTYFQSSVALLFLGVFLIVTLFCFFTYSAYFARGIADVRPLFQWLPVLLVFLVSAITMRQWAEEQKMGTLEILLTLPVRTVDLVLGKFLAGLSLVGIALTLTLPLPLLAANLGDLDWGPVIGGYVGALALAAAYLALGLAVSARTDNQVVALMVTLGFGSLVYLIGSDTVTAFFSTQTAEVLRAIGTGSRFASIERGVIDARDLVYYASISALFLSLNVYFLEERRIDAGSERGRQRRGALWLTLGLTAANVVAGNVWLARVPLLRLDLTADQEYSISDVTRRTLGNLEEPLTIEGYFSERTHPLLAPLIPQIRDVVAEYEVYGKGKVRVTFSDPTSDAELEQRVNEEYGIRSVPFRVADTHEQAVVNSYFTLLIRYGDKYETLSFEDLIEVQPEADQVNVRLQNLEYDLTRAVKKVTSEFQSFAGLLSKLPEGSKLTAYISPATLPPEDAATLETLRTVGKQISDKSGGRVTFGESDPTSDPALAEKLAKDYGIQPLAADIFATQRFYLHLVLEAGGQAVRIPVRPGMASADLEQALEAAVKRVTPGQLKTVGLVSENPVAPPMNPQIPPQFQPPPPQPDYRAVEQLLGSEYQIQRLDLADGRIPDNLDVLVIAKPGRLSPAQQYAVDQFLMRGGSVIALAGAYSAKADRGGLTVAKNDSSLGELLSTYGVKISDSIVMDPQNASFPIPVQERRGPFTVQRIQMLAYPYFADIRSDGMDRTNAALAGIGSLTTPWASPLEVTADGQKVKATTLLQTSAGSWLDTDGQIEPDFDKYPQTGFGVMGDSARRVVAVALQGAFSSHFAGKPAPEGTEGPVLESAPADTRLVIVGTSELASDLMVQVSQQPGGEMHRGDLQLLQNLVDWSVEDTDLLQIRSSGAFARTLRPMDESEATRWQLGTYAVVLGGLATVVVVPRRRRNQTRAIPLALEQA
jgi:ABC-2 type transport system permease protein